MELNKLYNLDCMEGMAQFPDKYFDLAIVDPPYGIGDFGNRKSGKKKYNRSKGVKWNNNIPNEDYFIELKRIAENHIIFGFQHYMKFMWDDLSGVIIHDFGSTGGWGSDGDLAIHNFNKKVEFFKYRWQGFIRDGKEETDNNRIHDCEKPVTLYKWLLKNYAQKDFKIIDTHAGSCSSVIAFLDYGCDWIAFEIDKDYYNAANKRIENHKSQLRLSFSGES